MPEHESMQDYIDMIDNEGLLASNKTKNGDSSNSKDGSDDDDIPQEEPVKSKSKSSIASS